MQTRLLALLLLTLASSCSMLDKKNSGSDSSAPTADASLANWKSKLFKSCSSDEIFHGKPPEQVWVDSREFRIHTQGSWVVTGDEGAFLVLGQPATPGMFQESSTESVIKVNQETTHHAKGRAVLENGICKVYAGDELVFETTLWSSVPVILTNLLDAEAKPQIFDTYETQDLYFHGYLNAINQAVPAKDKVLELLKKEFSAESLTPESLDQIFPGMHRPSISAQFVAPSESIVISSDYTQLADPQLTAQLKLDEVTAELTVYVNPPAIPAAEGQPETAGYMQMTATVNASNAAGGQRQYLLKSLELVDAARPFDNKDMLKCVGDRYKTYGATPASLDSSFLPAYPLLVNPCHFFAQDPRQALTMDAEHRKLIAQKFAGLTGTPQQEYYGWSGAAKDVVLQYLLEDKDVAAAFDFEITATVIEDLVTLAPRLDEAIASFDLEELRETLQSQFLEWPFSGYSVSSAQLTELMAAISTPLPEFEASVLTLVKDLGQDPNGQDSVVAFARQVNADAKEKAKQLNDLARNIGVDGLVEDIRLGTYLQKKKKFSASWIANLQSLTAFHDREKARLGENDFGFRSDFEALAKTAITENWQEGTFTLAVEIALHAPVSHFCATKLTASELINCLGSDKFTTSENNLLAKAHEGRYGPVAKEFRDHIQKLPSTAMGTAMDLERAFFTPVWASCSNSEFSSRRDQLKEQVTKLHASDDFLEQIELERAIDETIADCEE